MGKCKCDECNKDFESIDDGHVDKTCDHCCGKGDCRNVFPDNPAEDGEYLPTSQR